MGRNYQSELRLVQSTVDWVASLDLSGVTAAFARLRCRSLIVVASGGSIAAAQLLPAVPGAILGVPLGFGVFVAASGAGTNGTTIPSAGWLIPAVVATLIAVTALTAIPAWAGTRRPVTDVLAQDA